MKKILQITDKILNTMLLLIAIAVIGLYINTYFINPGYKGISHKDLSQIFIMFCGLYLIKYIIKILSSRNY